METKVERLLPTQGAQPVSDRLKPKLQMSFADRNTLRANTIYRKDYLKAVNPKI